MFIVPLHCCQNLTSFTLDVQQWLRMDHNRGSGRWITVITERTMWTHFDGLRTKLLLKIFYDFLIRHFKSHVSWNLKKKRKIGLRILELCLQLMADILNTFFETLNNLSDNFLTPLSSTRLRITKTPSVLTCVGRSICIFRLDSLQCVIRVDCYRDSQRSDRFAKRTLRPEAHRSAQAGV